LYFRRWQPRKQRGRYWAEQNIQTFKKLRFRSPSCKSKCWSRTRNLKEICHSWSTDVSIV